MAHFVEQAKFTTSQRENSNEKESLQARNGTHDERWFRACSKHSHAIDDADPGPKHNSSSATESICCPTAIVGQTARKQQPGPCILGPVFDDSERGQQQSVNQSEQHFGNAAIGPDVPFQQLNSQQHFRSERQPVFFDPEFAERRG